MGWILPRERLQSIVTARQATGERAVFTNGVFDLLHIGHIRYLQQARMLGDFLIVGLNSDASTRRLKGPRRPLVPDDERAELLAALTSVDYVTIFEEPTAEDIVAALRPAIYVKGGDYASADPSSRGMDVVLTPDELRAIVHREPNEHWALSGIPERLPEARVVAEYGGSLALITYLPHHSTSALIERIRDRYALPDESTGPKDA